MQLIVGSLMLYISLNVQKLLDDASTVMNLLTSSHNCYFLSSARKQRSRVNDDFHYACGLLCNSR